MTCRGPQGSVTGTLVNLSEGGALADLGAPFDSAEPVSLEVVIDGHPLDATGTVVRSEERDGRHFVAIAFDPLPEQESELIGELIARADAIAWTDERATIPRDVAARFIPIIRRIARGVAAGLPPHVSVDDLVGSGFVAFVDMYPRYAHLPPDELERVAKVRIRGAMLDELRELDPLSRRMRQGDRALAAARKELELELGHPPTAEQIAERAGVSSETYDRIANAAQAAKAVRLDEVVDAVAADPAQSPDRALQDAERARRLAKALDALPARLKQVLELYVGEDLTLGAIGNVLGVSEARVSQLLGDAVKRLRAGVASLPPGGPSR